MPTWNRFFRSIQQDIKVFLFTLGILTLFRLAFIVILDQYLKPETTMLEIIKALFWGMRLSLKTAGVITLLTFLFCTLPAIFVNSRRLDQLRLALGSVYAFLLTFLFHASLPYYTAYHTGFDYNVYNVFTDDMYALLLTLIEQYNFFTYIAFVIFVSWCLYRLLKLLLATQSLPSPQFNSLLPTILFRLAIILLIPLTMIFIRFGGSLYYAGSVHWENAAVSKDNFLNEAILDSIQGLTRAYTLHEKIRNATKLDTQPERIAEYAAKYNNQVHSNNIEDYLAKQTSGPLIPKPKHIVMIVGESFAEWPLLDKYKDLHLTDGMRSILAQDNAVLVPAFLPVTAGTNQALTSLVTGLPEIQAAPNYHPESYRSVYATSIAPQMKKLGYKTYFWYGGFSSWQRIQDFVLAQGFDGFYSSSDFPSEKGNAWGAEDKYLLNAVAESIKTAKDEYTFTIVLTTSNHPPYTVDLQREGFDPAVVKNNLPPEYQNNQELITMLGHHWYSDKVFTEFINMVKASQPETLFVVTGDHADRVNIQPNPSTFERHAIPFILYGNGVSKRLVTDTTAGDQLTIAPTLIELIAPKDFTYYSYSRSLTKGSYYGYGDRIIASNAISTAQPNNVEFFGNSKSAPDWNKIREEKDVINALAWWRIQKGNMISQ